MPPETSGAARDAPSCDNPRHALGEPANGQPSLRSWRPPTLLRNILSTPLMGMEKIRSAESMVGASTQRGIHSFHLHFPMSANQEDRWIERSELLEHIEFSATKADPVPSMSFVLPLTLRHQCLVPVRMHFESSILRRAQMYRDQRSSRTRSICSLLSTGPF